MSGVILEGGDWRAEVLPEAGGLISSLTHRGVEVLRTMRAGEADPLASACFPLVPYANRIAGGRFAWHGAEVRLPLNFAPEQASIHGHGWQAPWQVLSHGGFKCALEQVHDGATGWPWPYRVQQRVMLGRQGCAISLVLTNLGDSAMPAGLGLHPYFRRRPESRVSFAARDVVLTDRACLPTGEVAAVSLFGDFATGSALPASTIDHCYTGWRGTACVTDDLGTITLTATGAPHLHLYAPADGSALCLEPVSHAPDAVNRDPAGMTVLPPGCSASLRMEIGVG